MKALVLAAILAASQAQAATYSYTFRSGLLGDTYPPRITARFSLNPDLLGIGQIESLRVEGDTLFDRPTISVTGTEGARLGKSYYSATDYDYDEFLENEYFALFDVVQFFWTFSVGWFGDINYFYVEFDDEMAIGNWSYAWNYNETFTGYGFGNDGYHESYGYGYYSSSETKWTIDPPPVPLPASALLLLAGLAALPVVRRSLA